ncbi:putative protein YwgA [Candidatus Methanophagaceae archaeon]|nr:putative protein YwgA [Methanophagales archaeon]
MMEKLLPFMEFLEKEAGFRFDIEKFEHRLMLQKYVFISKFFGFNPGYSYSIYLRGPYSPALADDYYNFADCYTSYENDYTKELGGFNTDKFLEVIDGKDAKWLEIAATILSVYDTYLKTFRGAELTERVIATSCDIKSATDAEKIRHVFEELKRVGLIDA